MNEKIDAIVETLDSPVPIVAEAQISGTITFDNNSTLALNTWNFLNHSKPGGLWTYFNGKKAINTQTAEECSLFRGSNTEFNRTYNDDATSTSGYAGCYAENKEHPERCFPDLATKKIFDEEGTMYITDVPENAVGIKACYDFREEIRLGDYLQEASNYLIAVNLAATEEAKAAIPLPGNKYKPATEIVLSTTPYITLKDILDMYGGFDGKDNDGDTFYDEADEYSLSYKIDSEDPFEIGFEFLGNIKTHFILNNPPIAGVKKIVIDITQIPLVSNANKKKSYLS